MLHTFPLIETEWVTPLTIYTQTSNGPSNVFQFDFYVTIAMSTKDMYTHKKGRGTATLDKDNVSARFIKTETIILRCGYFRKLTLSLYAQITLCV